MSLLMKEYAILYNVMKCGGESLLQEYYRMRKSFLEIIHQYKYIVAGIIAIFCIETYFSFQFYSKEPDFPFGLFVLQATNGILRDLFLAGIVMFLQTRSMRVKQFAQNYLPIVSLAILWLSISVIIIHSLKLAFNTVTILSVIVGVINNVFFVLLAGCLYIRKRNLLTKSLYFLVYFFTVLVFYSDISYYFVTSTHIQRVVFENLNVYSIKAVLGATNTFVLLGILASFFSLILLFRTPRIMKGLPINAASIAVVVIVCITANLIHIGITEVYPKVLYACGFDEEGEIEKARNISRDLISGSVTIHLGRELLQNEERAAANPNQFNRKAFSQDEKLLLNELNITVDEKPAASEKAFPYEKVIVLVAESFHRNYLHYYNPQIPREATQFFDDLCAKYPHFDQYYTSNRPTTQGFNSMFLSQIFYSDEQGFENNATLFKILENNGYDTLFMDATSQYYNDEFRAYTKRFGMQMYRAKEDLEKQGYTGSVGWGFHNDVMYEETLRILEQNRSNKIFMVTKTIDLHQPYPYCGLYKENIPAAIGDNKYLKAIYWEDICLQKFFHDLEERDLMDDKTLIIVTSDHNPHPSQDKDYKSLNADDFPLSLAPIPLIFVGKNLQPFKNYDQATFASQIDFAPTLLGILGISTPAEFSGRNVISIPEEQGYAVGCYDGETVYYKSSDGQIRVDMYKEDNENDYKKALKHWIQDSYAKYFHGNKTNIVNTEMQKQI